MKNKVKAEGKRKSGVKLANQIMIRPNPFFVSKVRERRAYQQDYGDSVLRVYGHPLSERDRGTLIVFLDLSKRNGNRPFDFKLSDIAKAQNAKNPYARGVLVPIYESINRLLDVQIRIRPTKEHGLTAKFVLLEGYLDGDGTGNVAVGQYLDIIRDLALGCTYINPSNYFSIKSKIGRALHVFLESQQKFYKDEGYEIRLSKLIRYLNYDRIERPWFQIWPHVENAIKELKTLGFIGRYKRHRKRYPKDGGVVTFWPNKKKASLQAASSTKDTELLEKARALIDLPLKQKDEEKLRRYLDCMSSTK